MLSEEIDGDIQIDVRRRRPAANSFLFVFFAPTFFGMMQAWSIWCIIIIINTAHNNVQILRIGQYGESAGGSVFWVTTIMQLINK